MLWVKGLSFGTILTLPTERALGVALTIPCDRDLDLESEGLPP